ncbi:MAG: SH3 domain-containing protein [Clostridia bacterium]|nr:SH3 domain-containing protein [Clostridia bacterium]
MKTTKRIVSAVLCVLMIGSVLPLASFAAYENTHTNTGNQIEDLIAVATTQIGYTEGNSTSQQGGTSGGSGNYTKYGAWYGINPGAWCAMFVSWCANQAGIPSTVITKHASCDLGMQWFQNKGVWQWSKACGGNYQPKRGDIIYFRTNTAQVTDSTHVGIVTNSTSSTVYTIEGNASNKCQTKSYALTSAYILGYGTPAYSDNSGGGSTSNGATGLGTYRTSGSLNMRSGAGTSYGIVQTLPSGVEINITQISSNNWGYGTYNGISGWISLNTEYTTLVSTYYYITFDPNGGALTSSTSVYAIKVEQSYSAVISSMPTAARSGYDFNGWYCSEYNYTLSLADTFTAGKNVTFKAQWTPKLGQYTITTNTDPLNIRDAASSADSNVIGQVPKGTVVNITAISGDWGFTTYNGVTGWVSLAYCTYYGAPPAVEEPTPGAETYTLTFDVNGGSMPSGFSTTYTFEAEQMFNDVIGGFPVPTHSNKEFAGWYWDKAGENSSGYLWNDGWGTQQYVFWDVDNNNVNAYADATLVAKWVNHSHSYESSVTKAATCVAAGLKTYTCTGCGDSYTEAIAQLTHKYSSAVTKAPSCTETGIMTYTCSLCGNDYTESIAIIDHSYALSGFTVQCTSCSTPYTGWFGDTYCLDGGVVAGLFNVDGEYYYAPLTTLQIVKDQTVHVTTTGTNATNNGFLSDNGDSYYKFDSEGKLVKTGFVTGGGNTYYYDNTVKAKGLKQIDGDYYYFNDDGTMVKGAYVTVPGGSGIEGGRYFFRADGKMLYETDSSSKEVRQENGKYYIYKDGVKQTSTGLYRVGNDYYYALRDGSLATNRTLYTYYSNDLFTPGYYKFGSDIVKNTIDDAKMEKGTWYNHVDENNVNHIYATDENGTRIEGLVYANGNYYFFHKNSGELVTSKTYETIFISADNNNGIPVKSGVYTLDAAGVIQNPILTTSATAAATADGAESSAMIFSARAESNTVVSADTAATVIISALPVTSDDEDE